MSDGTYRLLLTFGFSFEYGGNVALAPHNSVTFKEKADPRLFRHASRHNVTQSGNPLTTGICSCFVPMMTAGIKSLLEAARHGLMVRVECKCGNLGLYRARDLMKEFGAARDPRSLRFRCTSCKPKPVEVTLVEIDHDRPPKTKVMKPFRVNGRLAWMSERFR